MFAPHRTAMTSPSFLRTVLTLASTTALASGVAACSSSDDPEGGQPSGPTPVLPAATGTCPAFVEGRATFTVNGTPRTVQLYVDPAVAGTADGPLIFYWYGTLGTPEESLRALGADGVAQIKAQGGVVAAPEHGNEGVFPWISGDVQKDFALMDEVVACAKATVGIDARHIHSLGFSAGGLFTGQASWARSTYLASVATYSGGAGGESADESNLFPAMILHGGTSDNLVLQFSTTSADYRTALVNKGHFAFICDHGNGHRIPEAAAPSVRQFFADHPYKGSPPDPYAAGLPPSFPSFCAL